MSAFEERSLAGPDLHLAFHWTGDECTITESRYSEELYWERHGVPLVTPSLQAPVLWQQSFTSAPDLQFLEHETRFISTGIVREVRLKKIESTCAPHIPSFHEREGHTRPIFHWQSNGTSAPANLSDEDKIKCCKEHWPKEISAGVDAAWGEVGRHYKNDPNIGVRFQEFPFNRTWSKGVLLNYSAKKFGQPLVLVSSYPRWSPKPKYKPIDPEWMLRLAKQMDENEAFFESDPGTAVSMRMSDPEMLSPYNSNPSRKTSGPVDFEKVIKEFRAFFNVSEGEERSPEKESRIRKHPKFGEFARQFRALTTGGSMENDNTLAKQFQRGREARAEALKLSEVGDPNFVKAYARWSDSLPNEDLPVPIKKPISGGWFVAVALNNRPTLYRLDCDWSWSADSIPETAELAFDKLHQEKCAEAERQARYRTRGQSLSTIRREVNKARGRIDDAFAQVSRFYLLPNSEAATPVNYMVLQRHAA